MWQQSAANWQESFRVSPSFGFAVNTREGLVNRNAAKHPGVKNIIVR
jgi:hypothetical protein